MSDLELDESPAETLVAETNRPETAKTGGAHEWRDALASISGVRIGVLAGLKDNGRTPLVIFSGQRDNAAIPARATLDLHGSHIGRDVVLMFEDGDPQQPIVLGCLPQKEGRPESVLPGHVDVDADGERLQVTAKEQLVLRCGKATITLTKAGKVLIQGTYVSSSSAGVNRIKGGSIQLN
jgi:hypothetical protein